jgi:Tol biopolymer transport system component
VLGQQAVSEVLVIPALGGRERRLATVNARREAGEWFDPGLSWSPDGLFLVTVHKESPDESEGVFLISTQTGEKKRLTAPPQNTFMRDRQPIFSPDGHSVAFVRGRGLHDFQLLIQSMDGGEPEVLHEIEGMISDVDWVADGSALVFSSFDERSRLREISA